METGDESFDDEARDEFQVIDAREDLGVQESSSWDPFLFPCFLDGSRGIAQVQIPDFGTGTAFNSCSTIWSVVTRSDCAWKFVRMR